MVSQVIEMMGISSDSFGAQAIQRLNENQLAQILEDVNSEDYLIHINNEGYSVNYGNVGTKGIWVPFWN